MYQLPDAVSLFVCFVLSQGTFRISFVFLSMCLQEDCWNLTVFKYSFLPI